MTTHAERIEQGLDLIRAGRDTVGSAAAKVGVLNFDLARAARKAGIRAPTEWVALRNQHYEIVTHRD